MSSLPIFKSFMAIHKFTNPFNDKVRSNIRLGVKASETLGPMLPQEIHSTSMYITLYAINTYCKGRFGTFPLLKKLLGETLFLEKEIFSEWTTHMENGVTYHIGVYKRYSTFANVQWLKFDVVKTYSVTSTEKHYNGTFPMDSNLKTEPTLAAIVERSKLLQPTLPKTI